MVADVALLGETGDPVAIVEKHHRHPVDEMKAEKLRGLPWLQLEATDVLENLGHWRPTLLGNLRSPRCPCQQVKKMKVAQRGLAFHVDYCPKRARVWRGKPYANLIDDCSSCAHLVAYHQDDDLDPGYIRCAHPLTEQEVQSKGAWPPQADPTIRAKD